jgi:hypothetical protein
LSRKISAEVFGLCGATTAGASGFFFAAALFLEKLLSDFLGEFFDEFFGGLEAARVALFDGRLGSFLDDFERPSPFLALPLPARGFFEAVARLAVPVDADFARGYVSFSVRSDHVR